MTILFFWKYNWSSAQGIIVLKNWILNFDTRISTDINKGIITRILDKLRLFYRYLELIIGAKKVSWGKKHNSALILIKIAFFYTKRIWVQSNIKNLPERNFHSLKITIYKMKYHIFINNWRYLDKVLFSC